MKNKISFPEAKIITDNTLKRSKDIGEPIFKILKKWNLKKLIEFTPKEILKLKKHIITGEDSFTSYKLSSK
jgi:hypothetical protein